MSECIDLISETRDGLLGSINNSGGLFHSTTVAVAKPRLPITFHNCFLILIGSLGKFFFQFCMTCRVYGKYLMEE